MKATNRGWISALFAALAVCWTFILHGDEQASKNLFPNPSFENWVDDKTPEVASAFDKTAEVLVPAREGAAGEHSQARRHRRRGGLERKDADGAVSWERVRMNYTKKKK